MAVRPEERRTRALGLLHRTEARVQRRFFHCRDARTSTGSLTPSLVVCVRRQRYCRPVSIYPLSNCACCLPAHSLPMILVVWLATDSVRRCAVCADRFRKADRQSMTAAAATALNGSGRIGRCRVPPLGGHAQSCRAASHGPGNLHCAGSAREENFAISAETPGHRRKLLGVQLSQFAFPRVRDYQREPDYHLGVNVVRQVNKDKKKA